MSSSMGKIFVLTTFGESHGGAVGAVVDGCPAGLRLSESDIQAELDRRRPGQSSLTTPRNESDRVEIVSGVENGGTLGSPICMMVRNADQRSGDYSQFASVPRPSHADLTYKLKYGVTAASGGGRASARETIGRVAGGAIAAKLLLERFGVEIVAWVSSVADVNCPDLTERSITRDEVDSTPVRCPDAASGSKMIETIDAARLDGDSVGGVITCVCRNVPAGIGEPVFDKISARLGAAIHSIPACKGMEIGSGFAGTRMRGSEHNDMFVKKADRIGTSTNRSGGVQGGITNGEQIVFRAAFKPVATVSKAQKTVDADGNPVTLEAAGRHDPCVLPRAVPVVEAMAALVIADSALIAGALNA